MSEKIDYDSLLNLLAEYSQKLRGICEGVERSRTRAQASVALFFTGVMIFIGIVYLYFEINYTSGAMDSFNNRFFISTALLIYAVTPMAFVLYIRYTGERRRNTRDARTLAASIERLVAMLSQHIDVKASGVNELVLFELRISEAESTLEIYRDGFYVKEGRLEKKFSL